MARKDENQITIPEDLSTLSDADLGELHDRAVAAFQAMLPEDGSAPSDEALDALSVLAEGIEAVKGEVGTRDNAALSRSTKARELADKVLSAGETAQEVVDEDDNEDEDESSEEVAEEEEALVAGARKSRRGPININLGALSSERPAPKDDESEGEKDSKIALAAQGAAGFNVGEPISTSDMAQSINSRLSGFNATSYMHAAERGSRQSERFTIAKIPRKFDERAVVNSENPDDAMDFVTNEKNLPGGSLVASGGWCAPSETLYGLVDISEAADLVSTPEMQINRGGVRHSLGPDYRAVYNNTGFCYTEAQDLAGDYNGAGGGSKPCTVVPCPEFTETRLGYCGVCISAGLLQQRGYPEAIEDYINKTLNAHAHRVSAAVINSMVAQSGSLITFPSLQAGAVAPLLTAIDLQATHYRAVNRMERNATIEVLLPTWTDVLVRADLARRLGVDLLSVPEARINAWFAERQVNPQYVVDWQDISTTPASGFLAAPTGVDFLMYAAGTFVKGSTDSITLENIYDSVLLGRNNYTALFTEDPYLVVKRNHDARRVRVPVTPDGATHVGIDIKPDGTV